MNTDTLSMLIDELHFVKETLKMEFLASGRFVEAGAHNRTKKILRELEDLVDIVLGLAYEPNTALRELREMEPPLKLEEYR